MPKWISIEKAAFKYGINEEVIWLWIEMNRFPVAYTKDPPAVDEEGMDDFLRRGKDRVMAEYIDTLEELCMQKTKICLLYAEIIGAQDKELLLQREKIARMNEIQIAMRRQGERMQDCAKVLMKYEKPFHISWVDRLWNNLKQLLSGVKHWTGLK